jgi:hypothetical protein
MAKQITVDKLVFSDLITDKCGSIAAFVRMMHARGYACTYRNVMNWCSNPGAIKLSKLNQICTVLKCDPREIINTTQHNYEFE